MAVVAHAAARGGTDRWRLAREWRLFRLGHKRRRRDRPATREVGVSEYGLGLGKHAGRRRRLYGQRGLVTKQVAG